MAQPETKLLKMKDYDVVISKPRILAVKVFLVTLSILMLWVVGISWLSGIRIFCEQSLFCTSVGEKIPINVIAIRGMVAFCIQVGLALLLTYLILRERRRKID